MRTISKTDERFVNTQLTRGLVEAQVRVCSVSENRLLPNQETKDVAGIRPSQHRGPSEEPRGDADWESIGSGPQRAEGT